MNDDDGSGRPARRRTFERPAEPVARGRSEPLDSPSLLLSFVTENNNGRAEPARASRTRLLV